MNRLTGVLVAVAGVSVGFLAAMAMRDAAGPGGAENAGAARRAAALSSNGAGKERSRLAELEQMLKRKGTGPDYRALMERLSTGELHEVMQELAVRQTQRFHPNSYVSNSPPLAAAAEELFRREGLAALEWANGFTTDSRPGDLLRIVLLAAVADDPAAAKPWVDAYQKSLEGTMAGAWNPFVKEAVRKASSQGVDALVALKDIFDAKVVGDAELASGPLPEDFDFRRLMEEFPRARGMDAALQRWGAKDPDAAWSAVRELYATDREMSGSYNRSIFTGMCQTVGEVEATKWLVSRLDELQEPFRCDVVHSLLNDGRTGFQMAENVMASLPSDSDRVALAAGMIAPFQNEKVLGMLKSLKSQDMRVDALVESAKRDHRYTAEPLEPMSIPTNDFYAELMIKLDLSPADRKRVMDSLNPPAK